MQIWILDLVSRSWTFSEIYCFYTQDELSNYFRLFVADPTNLDLRTALFVIEDLQFLYSDPQKYADPSIWIQAAKYQTKILFSQP